MKIRKTAMLTTRPLSSDNTFQDSYEYRPGYILREVNTHEQRIPGTETLAIMVEERPYEAQTDKLIDSVRKEGAICKYRPADIWPNLQN